MAVKTNKDDRAKLERLESLLGEGLAVMGQLDALSQRQGALAELDDVTPLLSLLAERQVLIERATEIAGEVAVLRAQCVHSLVPAARWGGVQRSCDAVADLAERVAKRDREDTEKMSRRRDEAIGAMNQLDRGRGASAAYVSKNSEAGPIFQDRQG